jgi:tRNA (guanine37-N1)-methyltransferase
MRVEVVTLFPEMVEAALKFGVLGRAIERRLLSVGTEDPRRHTQDVHKTVDDRPYGGGPGMVLKPEPMLAAIRAAHARVPEGSPRIYLSAQGALLDQKGVEELARLPGFVLVAGRYEGLDERVIDLGIDREVSIGDYVLSGGELPALVLIDAVARLIPGVLGEPTSTVDESHAAGLLEYPQYTRPPKLGARDVPAILTSGNHAAIAAWRHQQAVARTAQRRPDLLARHAETVRAVAARTHLALVHHPVLDRTGKVVTSALTNFDVHDLARSSLTYGLAGYHLVTPVTSQREKAEHIAALWQADELPSSRGGALARVRTASSIADLVAELGNPRVVATSARADVFPNVPRRTAPELVAEAALDSRPVLILLGTGHGLADSLIPDVSCMLAPIDGLAGWNHLAVRSAGAILLDRLFGSAT